MEHDQVDLDVLKASQKARPLPRPFSFHWGAGNVVEEAWMVSRWNEPAIQLLQYEDGSLSIRFSAYTHRGAFQRSPLMLDENDIAELRESLNECPQLKTLLKRLVDGDAPNTPEDTRALSS